MEARIAIQNSTHPSNSNWNRRVATVPNNFSIEDLLDYDTGESTGWALDATEVGTVGSATSGTNSVGSGDAAWVDEAIITQELHFTGGAGTGYDLVFSGLDTGKTYTLEVFGSLSNSNRVLSGTIGEETLTLNTGSSNLTNVMRFSDVEPNGSGEILLAIRADASTSGAAAFAAMRVIESGSPAVAQPPFTSVTVTG